jgi:hypothetical protein
MQPTRRVGVDSTVAAPYVLLQRPRLRPLALLENNGWRHQTLHYQLLALTNGVMSGSHDQLINQL